MRRWNKRTMYAAAVAAALFVYNPAQAQQQGGPGTPQMSEDRADNIESVLTDVLNSVFSKDYDGLVENFATPDQNRLQDGLDRRLSALDPVVDSIKNAWQDKYQDDYSDGLEGAAIPYAVSQNNPRQASVQVPAGTPRQAIALNMVNEGGMTSSWRLDIPDQISADQIGQHLETALRDLDQQKNQWPADPRAAYRATAQRVFAAIIGNQGALKQALNVDPGQQDYRRGQFGDQSGPPQSGQQ